MLKQLASDLRRDGGFEVHAWAGGVPQLNDFAPMKEGSYVRAVHNIRDAKPTILSPIGAYVWFAVGEPPHSDNYDVLSDGVLRGIKYKKGVVTHPCKRLVREGGFLGFFSTEKEVVIKQSYNVEEKVSGEPRLLGDVLDQTDIPDEWAHFIDFTLKAPPVTDSAGRPGKPRLTVVTNGDLRAETVKYLKENPEDYYNLVMALLPPEEFPNVNANILSKIDPAEKIYHLIADRGRNLRESRGVTPLTYRFPGASIFGSRGGSVNSKEQLDQETIQRCGEVLIDRS